MDETTKQQINQILQGIERIEKVMAMNQAQLDAAIAALPAAIEAATVTAVDTQLQPIITALQNAANSGQTDFTPEVTALQNLASTIAPSVATTVVANLVPTTTPAPAVTPKAS